MPRMISMFLTQQQVKARTKTVTRRLGWRWLKPGTLLQPVVKAQGKPIASVLGDFGRALLAVAEVGTFGADKYTRGGWVSVPDGVDRYTDALYRHLLAEASCASSAIPTDLPLLNGLHLRSEI